MTPFDDIAYIINHVLLGDEPTIEDFILLVGTVVAFIAFILWCCFPIQPKKDNNSHRQFCGSQNSLDANTKQIQETSSNYNKSTLDYGIKNGHHCYS